MSVPFWAVRLADAFWKLAGDPGPFPRDLRPAIAFALPLVHVPLHGLTIENMTAWLEQQGIPCPRLGPNRLLRGCLIACNGHGVAFVEADDPEAEQRFTLGHELGHFLRHYWDPRDRARRALGAEILEVFDGERPPTPTERVNALLRNVRLGWHVHLMERDDHGRYSANVAVAEEDADRLAFELLAPEARVLREQRSSPALAERLQHVFGLPLVQAERYAAILAPQPPVAGLLLRLRQCTETDEETA